MDVYDALRYRRSTKRYGQESPPREVIERIIEAATWAPNHHLTEPWRFFVLQGNGRADLGERVAQAMVVGGETEGFADATRTKLMRAPVLIIVAQTNRPADPTLDLEDYAAVCAATQNLLLAAQAEGLTAKWSTGELATMPAVFEYLGLSHEEAEGDRIVAFIYIGSSDPEAAPLEPRRNPAPVEWRG